MYATIFMLKRIVDYFFQFHMGNRNLQGRKYKRCHRTYSYLCMISTTSRVNRFTVIPRPFYTADITFIKQVLFSLVIAIL